MPANKKNRQLPGSLISLSSGVLWALAGIFLGLSLANEKLALFIFAPLVLAFLNDFACFVMMLAAFITKADKRQQIMQVLRSNSKFVMFLAAMCGGPLGMACYVFAIKYIGFAYTASISVSYPSFGALFAVLLLKEKLVKMEIFGVLLATGSAMVLGYVAAGGDDSTLRIIGVLFAFGAAVGWGSEVILCAYVMKCDVPAEIAYFFRQMFSSLGYIVILSMVGDTWTILTAIAAAPGLLVVIAATAMAGLSSYLLYYKGISLIGPVRAMALNITYAAWGVLLSWLLLEGIMTTPLVVLCVLIMLGSFMTTSGSRDILYGLLRWFKSSR